MIRKMRKAGYGMLTVFLILGLVGYALAGSDMKVVGTVGEDNTITDESGAVYEIGDNEKGEEISELAGKKVEIMGTIEEEGGTKTIVIDSFKLME
jgi:hypothetical protein